MGFSGKIPDSLSGNWDKSPSQAAPRKRLPASQVVGPPRSSRTMPHQIEPEPLQAVRLAAVGSRVTEDKVVAQDAKRGIWAPPAVSTLPVMATAAGNALDPDFTIPNLLPPPQLPCPPCVVDRVRISGALSCASPDRKAAAPYSDQRIWVPPAVIKLPVGAAMPAAR